MTRKLTIRTKLAGTLAVPLAALAAFAGLQVVGARDRADQVKRQSAIATSATGPAGLFIALENERDYEALWQIGEEDLVQSLVDKKLQTSGDATSRTDAALSDFRVRLHDLGGQAAQNYQAALSKITSDLGAYRKDAQRHASTSRNATTARQANKIFDDYTGVIERLLDVDQKSSASINDAKLHNGAELLNAIARQNDIEKQIGLKAIVASLTKDISTAAQVEQLGGVHNVGNQRLNTLADGDFSNAMRPTLTNKAYTQTFEQLQSVAQNPLRADVNQLFAIVSASAKLWSVPQTKVANIVTARAQTLKDDAASEQRTWEIVMVASVLLAIAMLWLANKWITRPLRSLAEQAGEMAGTRLPDAVREILETPPGIDVQKPDVESVRVRGGGEVRDVALALNRVQDSALQLALEQARLRGNVADAFVNLGRRNQNLLSRQLEFITQLENEESDPETLEHLFKLDHLATRMRRNAESLLVLAGYAPPRTWSAPVEIGDVVRGALGEVEGYQRVQLKHLDDARVDGGAAVDVSHVIAELVENALTFSPPTEDVEVYGRKDEHGYVLTIVDRGIGMAAEDIDRVNALISSADARTFAPSRFLGHYVVAQLAVRHGLQVHLSASPAGGLTVMVALPPELVGDRPALDVDALPPTPLPDHEPERPVAQLPRRGAAVDEPEPVAPEPAFEPLAEVPPFSAFAPPEPTPAPAPAVDADAWAFARDFAPEPPAPEPASAAEAHAPVFEPELAPPVTAFAAPEPEPEPAPAPQVEPAPEPEPAPPPRPRLGIGTFADLRDAAVTPPPQPAPSAPPPVPEPEPMAAPPVDRAAAFAQVADAVDAVTTPAESDAVAQDAPLPAVDARYATTFSEDLLPQKLPKRGGRRSSSRLSSPWSREKKAVPPVPVPAAPAAAAPPVAAPAPAMPAPPLDHAPAAAPDATSMTPAPGALHFPPGGPALAAANGDAAAASTNDHPPTEGDDRFAFFAAFRAAAERAREEAGIDDRRIGQ